MGVIIIKCSDERDGSKGALVIRRVILTGVEKAGEENKNISCMLKVQFLRQNLSTGKQEQFNA